MPAKGGRWRTHRSGESSRCRRGSALLGAFDGFLLWANLSVSLLVIVAGAFLVLPFSDGGLALSLPVAIGAIVAAAVVGQPDARARAA